MSKTFVCHETEQKLEIFPKIAVEFAAEHLDKILSSSPTVIRR